MTGIHEQISSLFGWLVGSTLQAGILIVVILAVRSLVRGRIEARWYCLLWVLVLVRLATPWAPPSRFSVFNWVPGVAGSHAEAVPVESPPAPSLPRSAGLAVYPVGESMGDVAPAASAAPPPSTPMFWPSSRTILEWAWLIGGAALVLWMLLANLALWLRVRRLSLVADPTALALLAECSRQIGLRAAPRLIETDLVCTPALFGLLRPRLLMPAGMIVQLGPQRLKHVFLHELAHMKRHDTLAGVLAAVLQAVHWFNPLVWLAFRRMRSDREVACDALALSHLPASETCAYGRTLIDLAESLTRPRWQPGLAGIMETSGDLKRRITMISRFHAASPGRSIAAAILLALVGCIGLTDAQTTAPAGGDRTFSPDKSYTIHPGKGLDIIQVGDTAEKVEALFGKPPIEEKSPAPKGGRWLNYRHPTGIDFLTDEGGRIIEIRLNKGFKGELADGTRLGDSLENVVERSGGATRTVDASRDQTHGNAFGENRVLYNQRSGDAITAYKFVDGQRGVLYWFNSQKKLHQIVVFHAAGGSGRGKVDLPEGSRLDASGRIVDRIDYPFVDDPQAIGEWKSVDFVADPKQFKPGSTRWKGDLFFKGLTILANGRTAFPWLTWTKGRLIHSGDRTASGYTIQEMDGKTFMFFEWKSGDYTIRHQRPQYYVLEKVSSDTGEIGRAWANQPDDATFNRELPDLVKKLDIENASLEDIIRIFGEPGQYLWGNESFTRDKLPERYIMQYPADFSIAVFRGRIFEIRFRQPGYNFADRLQVGSSLDEALEVLGTPDRIIDGEKCQYENNVLYKNMDQRPGYGYYARADKRVRLFFMDGKVIALFVTSSHYK